MELGVLGPLHVRQFGLPVAIPGAKPRAILTLLGLHGGAVVPGDALVELLWGTDPPRTAVKALQTHISALRRALGDGFVLTQGAGWALNGADIDAVRYTAAAGRGRAAMAAGEASQAAACFDEALKLWRGAPELPGGRRGETARTRWIEGHAALVEDRADALLATGRAAELIGELEAAIADAPLRERRWGQLMLALYRCGRQGEALGAYRRVRQLLADELGVDPGPDLRRLESKIVVQDGSLEVPVAQHVSSVMRAVTFLLTDIEGSTAAWEADTGAMGESLARHDEIIEQAVTFRGGRLIKTRGEGDATFSVFDRPSAAAAAALELQQAIRREPWSLAEPMRIRIALHTGEVEFRDGDYFGRAVNRAARLRSLALGGQTLCSGATAELVIDSLSDDAVLVDLGMRQLKNLTRPEHVFELRLDTTDDPGVPAAEVLAMDRPDLPAPLAGGGPFVGRGSELGQLLESWHATLSAGTRAVLIAGEPGVGKTRLAGEWSRQAYDQAAVVLYGRCDEDLGAPYQPFAEALRRLVPCMGSNRLRGLRGAESLLPLVPDLTEVLPDLAAAPRAAPDTERYALFDAVVAILGVASTSVPIVLVLDDLHWAAKPTLLLLRHLLRFGETARVQIVGTYRSTDLDRAHPLAAMLADLHRDGSATRLTLGGLDESDVTAYVAEAGYDDDELARALASVTGGNPFFLIEALRHVHESGGRWDPNSLPQGVREAVSRRLSRLPVETNKALAAAAVVGSRFAVDLVERVVEQDLVDAFDEAGKAGILLEEPGGLYRFNHAIVRQSLLAELASVRRMRLHHKIAVVLESEPDVDGELLAELAYHYFECAWSGNAGKAVEYCRRAADQAMARLGYEGAADLYDKALHALEDLDDEVPDRADQQAELLVARCEALLAAGDVVSATGAVAQLRLAASDSVRRAAWGTCFDGQLSMLTDPERLDEIEAAVGAAAGSLAELGDAAGEAKAHTVRAGCLARLGRIGDCESALDQALTAARRAHEHRRVNAVLAGAPLAALWGPNPVPRAGGRCLDVVRLLRITTGSPVVEATSTRCQGVLDALRGRAAAGRQLIDSARRTLNELGMRHAVLEVEQFAGIIELIADEPAAAETYLRRAYLGFRRMGLEADTAETAALLARACLALGRDAEADELCTTSERLAGHAFKAAIAWRTVRAQLLSRRGDHGEARRTAEEAVAIAERTDALVDHGDACLALATVLGAAGDAEGARATAERAAALYELKGAAALAEKAQRLFGEQAVTVAPDARVPEAVNLENACVRVARRVDDAWNRDAWDELERLVAPSIGVDNRRKVVGLTCGELASSQWISEAKQVRDTGLVRYKRTVVAVRGELLALTRVQLNTLDVSAGAPQVEMLALYGIDAYERLALQITFDVEDLDAAMAELDTEFGRIEQSNRPRLENSASRLDARFNAGFAERRWDQVKALFADDVRVDDRRPGLRRGADYDSVAGIAEIGVMADLGVNAMTSRVIAIRGDRLALCRTRWDTHPDSFHTEVLRIIEIGADGRCVAFVVFDVGNLDDAYAELDERYLEGEAVPYAHTWSVIVGANAAFNRHGYDASSVENIDHRRVMRFAPGDLTAAYTKDLTPNLRCYIECAHRLGESMAVVTCVSYGTSREGFDAEWRVVQLVTVDGELMVRNELFDEADLDAACATFDQLGRRVTLENTASRVEKQAYSFVEGGRWEELAELFAEDLHSDDRRRGLRRTYVGRAAAIAESRATVSLGSACIATSVIATRGERLALSRIHLPGDGGSDSYYVEFLRIVEIGADDVIAAFVTFDLEGMDSALEELDARFLAGEAAQHARAWSVVTGNIAAFNRHEFPARTPDAVDIDHRRVTAFEPGDQAAYVRATWEQTPDLRIYIEAVHRLNDLGAVFTYVADGTSHQDFVAEWRGISLSTFDGDRISRSERFDEADLDAALVRFDELSLPARQLTNAANEVCERLWMYFEARDWDAVAALFSDDFSNDDGRRVVNAGMQYGRDAQLVNLRRLAEIGANVLSNVLATRGQRLVLSRFHSWNSDFRYGEFDSEMLVVIETDAIGLIRAGVIFDSDDIDAAHAELDARYLAGEAAERGDTWSVIVQTFASFNRHEQYPTDWIFLDHRRGYMPFASEVLATAAEAVRDLTPDLRVYVTSVHRLSDIGAVITQTSRGSSEAGFDVEWNMVQALAVDSDRVSRCELFDEDDLDSALARFDELSRPAQRLANAASREHDRFINYYAAGDWDGLALTMADDFSADDRRRLVGMGLQSGRDTAVSNARVTSDLGVRTSTQTVVAIRGERLALMRARFWGRDHRPDAFYIEVLHLVEIDARQRIVTFVAFDLDDLDAAIALLDARYLAGEAAEHAHIWSAITRAYSAMAQEQMPGTTPDLVNIDHRHVAPMAPDEGIAYLRASWDLAPEFKLYIEAVHRLSDVGAVFTRWSTGTSRGGFDAEWRAVDVVTVRGELISRGEIFDTVDLGAALARFDELSSPATCLENAASRACTRYRASFAARDWEAAAEMLADSLHNEDRRPVVNAGIRHGRDSALEDLRVAADLGIRYFTAEEIAMRGERLALSRGRTPYDECPGSFLVDTLQIAEIDADGRIATVVLYGPDDLDAAFAELEARYLAGEAAEHAHIWSAIADTFAALNRRELPEVTPDWVSIDHRRGARASAPGDLLARTRATLEDSPDFTVYVETVHALNRCGAVVTYFACGTTMQGFQAEWREVSVSTVEGDRVDRTELFDDADLAKALARFDELSDPTPRLENAASQMYECWLESFETRDWRAMAAMMADDIFQDDRRHVVNGGTQQGREAVLANMRAIAAVGVRNIEPSVIATRGDRLALSRQRVSGDKRPEAFGTEVLIVVEVDAENRFAAGVAFDVDDIDTAFEELDSRFRAGEAAPYAQTWSVVAGAYAAISRHEIPASAPEVIDRRRISAVEGEDVVASLRTAWDLTPDGRVYIECVHGLTNLGAVVSYVARGTGQGGFDAEWTSINVLTRVGDRIDRCELFDETDLDVALAKFDELSRPTSPPENAASRVCGRFRAAFSVRDWDAMSAMLADDLVSEDHRRVVNAGIRRGRDAEIADLRATVDIGAVYLAAVDVATRGERLVLVRLRLTGDDSGSQAFDADVLQVVEVDTEERIIALGTFDADQVDAALAELDARYVAGEAAPHAPTWARVTQTYAAFNRHELSATTPDWENIDHRLGVGSAPGDMNTYVSAFWELVPDIETRIVAVHRLSDLGAVFTHTESGTSHDGFDAEWREVALLTFDGEAIDRCELFDEADLGAACARFDELIRPPVPLLENAASRSADLLRQYYAARDWVALGDMVASDSLFDDRRRVVNSGRTQGRETAVAQLRSTADAGTENSSSACMATRGDRLALGRFRYSSTGVEPFFSEFLAVVETDSDNRVAARTVFDLDDVDAAFAELDARYLVGEGAAHDHTWSVIANANAVFNQHQIPPTASDWANIDHRRVIAFEPGEMTEYIRATWEVAPDMRNEIVAVHRLSDCGAVFTQAVYGTSHAGFGAEWRDIVVLTVDGDLLNRCEVFEEADLDSALLRFDELSRPPAALLENDATHTWTRLTDAFNRRDVTDMLALTSADGELDDRRTGVRDLQDGSTRERVAQTMFEYPASWRLEVEHLAVRGARLCLSRQRLRDTDDAEQPITIELLTVLEVGDDGVARVFVNFDPADLDCAACELDARWMGSEDLDSGG